MTSLPDTRHTPGPWHIEPVPARYSTIGNGTRIVSESGIIIGAVTRVADKPIDQKVSDARLIAAAPEMLEALEGILCLHEGHHNNPVHAKARAIIRKATGHD